MIHLGQNLAINHLALRLGQQLSGVEASPRKSSIIRPVLLKYWFP